MKSVEITVNDDGSVLVGSPPEADDNAGDQSGSTEIGAEDQGEEQDESSYMQPAKSVDDALRIARQLLTSDTPDQQKQAETDMQSGFNSVRGPDNAGGYG
jgi:hypothetical protein